MNLALLSCPSSWDENREVMVPRARRPVVNVDEAVSTRAVTEADVLAALSGGSASEPNKPILFATLMGRISTNTGVHGTEQAVRRLLESLASDGSVGTRRRRTAAGMPSDVEFFICTKPRVQLDVDAVKRGLLAALSHEPRTPGRIRGIAVVKGHVMPHIDQVRARLNDLVVAGKARRIEVDGPEKLYTLVPAPLEPTKARKPRKPYSPRWKKRDVTGNPKALREVILSVLTDKPKAANKVLDQVHTHAIGAPDDTGGILGHLKDLVAQGLVVVGTTVRYSKTFKLAPSTGGAA